MHFLPEYGIAAHWNYKEGGQKVDNLDKGLTWIRKALETSAEGRDSDEAPAGAQFMDNLKTDVLSSDVFVFTPKGQGRLGAERLYLDRFRLRDTHGDWAQMRRHDDKRAHRADGPGASERRHSRILTSPQGKPSRDWLKIAKSSRTRAKIKSWFRQQERQEREEKSRRGRELLEKEASRRNPGVENPLEPISPQLAHIARELGYASLDELVIAVGSGNHSPSSILGRITPETPRTPVAEPQPAAQPPQQRKEADSEIVVDGTQGVLVTLAQCCRPIPATR